MKETVTLNRKEQTRAKALALLGERRCTTREAAELMGVSRRHLFRLKKAYREEGPGGLAHGNRGRRPAHAIAEDIKGRVIELAENGYFGYNHTHLHEELEGAHAIPLSRRSLTRILRTAGLRSPRRRRPRRHRSRRERMPQEGMLMQVDGSHHDWLEGRGPRLVLVGAVDDATGELVHAMFREQEDAQGYLMLLRESVRKKGVPIAWYSDRHSIFRRNDKEPWTLSEELAGRREPTKVARALEELGINLILAHSPQAKGRVERCWGTLQDRLVKELRRASACTLEEGKTALKTYPPPLPQRLPPRPRRPYLRRLPRAAPGALGRLPRRRLPGPRFGTPNRFLAIAPAGQTPEKQSQSSSLHPARQQSRPTQTTAASSCQVQAARHPPLAYSYVGGQRQA